MNPYRLLIGAVLGFALCPVLARGEAPRPEPPKQYDVTLRYRIYAGRNERLRQYYALLRFFKKVGFEKDTGEFGEDLDSTHTVMTGTIASQHARKLLYDDHVKTVRLVPAGYKLPEEGRVKVLIDIVGGLPLDRQRLLHLQTAEKLAQLGFQENIAYDHKGYRQLMGTIPVEQLDTLQLDLRGQPGGWFLPDEDRVSLPEPLRGVAPIQVVEVTPEPAEFPPPRPAPAAPEPLEADKQHLAKISPELAKLLGVEGEEKPRRIEIILNYTPADDDNSWRRELNKTTPNLIVEARLGPLVTLFVPASEAPYLAKFPFVSVVRLPREARPQSQLPRGTQAGNLDALKASGLLRLHTLGHRGNGIRVAVVDADFRGWETLQNKKNTRDLQLVDLTAMRNRDVQGDPYPGDAEVTGHGTELARAVILAAPQASVVLVRIGADSPYQLLEVARYINGEEFFSESFAQRRSQLAQERLTIEKKQDEITRERNIILNNFGQDEENIAKRKDFYKREAEFNAELKAFNARFKRFVDLQQGFRSLRDINIATSALVWDEGYPLGGSSPVTRYFDDRPFKKTLWFHSAGNTRDQAWTGLFRDDDKNGVMEFVPFAQPLPEKRWTPELNFLGWRPYPPVPEEERKKLVRGVDPELPAKTTIRLSLQWREPHDAEFYRRADDPYLTPLADLKMVLLRQRDPSALQIAGDDMEVVARSYGQPRRIDHRPSYSVYEQVLEVKIEPAGRYAVRIEGVVPPGIRPPGSATLPHMQVAWELKPRLFVEVVDDASRQKGRVVFQDFPTIVGALATPADSRTVLTVGAVGPDGLARSYSTVGPPMNVELLVKPDLLSQDDLLLGPGESGLAFGSSQAAAFAAGLAASSFSSGSDQIYFLRALRERLGKQLLVP
ncbi:MAG: hypothetical protein AB7K24_12155 [Gemmataceae bacterium]